MPAPLHRLEDVSYRFGDAVVKPFDPGSAAFAARVDFDRERLADLASAVRSHADGTDVLELGATPYILAATLAHDGFRITLNGLPFDGHRSGAATLVVGGVAHECRLDLFDVEVDAFPYADATFDAVVAGEIFEHLYRQPWSMIREAWRCLRHDGVLIVSTPNVESLDHLYKWARRRPQALGFNPTAPTVRHAREYSVDELTAILESQGFDVLAIDTRNYSHIRGGFPGALGPPKRVVYTLLNRLATRRGGPLGHRGASIVAVARKNSERAPGEPPEFMLYAIGDPAGGYNFAHGQP